MFLSRFGVKNYKCPGELWYNLTEEELFGDS